MNRWDRFAERAGNTHQRDIAAHSARSHMWRIFEGTLRKEFVGSAECTTDTHGAADDSESVVALLRVGVTCLMVREPASNRLSRREPKWELPVRSRTWPMDTARWQETIAELSDHKDPLRGALRIDEIREQFEDVCFTAESRLRTMLRRLPQLSLAPEPQWLTSALDGLGASSVDPRAIESGRRLVRAMFAITGASIDASLQATPSRGLEIAWNTDSRLTWVIAAPRLSWPGVNVHAYAREGTSVRARSFFVAHRAVFHAGHLCANTGRQLSQ
jgi:hypothetical protein